MKLAINIGNTHIWCAIEDHGYLKTEHFDHDQFEKSIHTFIDVHADYTVALASVVPTKTDSVIACLQSYNIQQITVLDRIAIQEHGDYGGWDGIGIDRLMLAAGSSMWDESLLVCDFGTAITLNHIDNQRIRSGFILPGFTMSARALHTSTGLLPQVSFHQECTDSPQTTISNIQSGIVLSAVAFVEAIAQEKKAKIIITGGHALLVQDYFKSSVVYEPNLLIKGMLQFI